MTAKSTTPIRETARQTAELEAMLRMLDLSSGSFSLSIAVCNSPAFRDYLIEKLKQSRPDIQVVRIPVGITDVLEYVREQIDVSKCSAVFIAGLEELLSSSEARQPVLRHLNASRELLERDLRCPVVIWLPEYAAGLLSREAPDLWRYRSHRFEFVSEQAGAAAGIRDYTSGDISIAANLPADEKRFRIAELEQRIREAGPTPDKGLTAYVAIWLNELAFLRQSLGEIDEAAQTLRRLVAMHMTADNKAGIATDYGNLGILYGTRGDLAAAEEMYRKALALNEKLGRKEGMAIQYGNLGILYRTRGDLAAAEEMYRKALALNQELGRKEGVAIQYSNLGNLYLTRVDPAAAEEMHGKALVLFEELGSKEGMAASYGSLGILYRIRGDLATAEEMYRKSLRLYEELGGKQGMGTAYGNLGILYSAMGDIATAEEMYRKALALHEELGFKEGVAIQYGNLGILYRTRGDLAAAEKMYRKALALHEELGRKEGMANQYHNLGILYQTRGDPAGGEEMFRKALKLFREVGAKPEIEKTENLLRELKADIRVSARPTGKASIHTTRRRR